MDVAGTVVGILSLGIQVTKGLIDFYSACKEQQSDIADTQLKLNRLLGLLHEVDGLTKRKFPAEEQPLVDNITKQIEQCGFFVEKLKRKAEKFQSQPADDIRSIACTAAYRLAYPFRQSTLQKLDENIEEIISHLSLGVQLLTQRRVHQIHDSVAEHTRLLELIRAEEISTSVHSWLNAQDATVDYNRACNASHPGTGLWFINSAAYSSWLQGPSSFLWLNGFAGCGKTVLCSTIIRHTFQHRQSNQNVGLAFFFFSFSDKGKQDSSAMLRAVVQQLASQLRDGEGILDGIRKRCHSGEPPIEVLIDALNLLARSFSRVYILLDALDESPRDEHRQELLDTLHMAWRRLPPTAHWMVTSRDEIDIREMLTDSFRLASHTIITLRNDSIDVDIQAYIQGYLKNNRGMRKLEEHHAIIEQVLTQRAQGVFRWVDCQLATIASGAGSKQKLQNLLESLPRSLDETYEQMLARIHPESTKDAIRILKTLCCATRPLKVAELIDAVAIDLETHPPRLNPDARLFNADEILRICPGFIEIYEVETRRRKVDTCWYSTITPAVPLSVFFENEKTWGDGDMSDSILTQHVRLAHFSIQEYLESERALSQFRVERAEAHTEMSGACLSYLLESPINPYIHNPIDEYIHRIKGDDKRDRKNAKFPWDFIKNCPGEYPLLRYASTEWLEHYQLGRRDSLPLKSLVLQLFLSPKATFDNWLKTIYQFDQKYPGRWRTDWQGGNRLHIAVLYNLDVDLMAKIIQEMPDSVIDSDTLVTEADQVERTPLEEVCYQNNEAAVRLLLNEGAGIRRTSWWRPTGTLETASAYGNEIIVQILLSHGTHDTSSVNKALQEASKRGHEKVVQTLLDHRAGDVKNLNKALRQA
ncbi:uncharacterized protein E0L32_006061 [Thyridium curvatum]|uniref:NACHT domain-containing protein n=1 Tax=Thyridium curvatum TaxID=1093900 RepID=A0A507BAH9_9PEZI|nr:uncharacterized protein E0L32_006061 [Thyridium curvatum]TPX13590.1 hypothetical protein E0L32_006061 [Thyridium curvatum]